MNYYARIHELLSADQVIAESTEEQQRIDELLSSIRGLAKNIFGRTGRAAGQLFGTGPKSHTYGNWNPLSGKYEGGLNQEDRMAVYRNRAEKRKAASGVKPAAPVAPTGFKTPNQTKIGMPKSMGNIGKLPSATPAPTGFKTPAETKLGMPKSMGNIGKLPSATPAPAPAKPNLLAPPKPVKNIMPPTGDEFGAGIKNAPTFKPTGMKVPVTPAPTKPNPLAPPKAGMASKPLMPPTGDEFGAGIKDAPKFKPTGKKVPVTAPTSAGFRTPSDTKIGMPKSRGNIGKLPSAAPAPFDPRQPVTPGAQPQATGGRKAKKVVAQQGQGPLPQQGQGPKPAPTRKPQMSPEEKSARYTSIAAQEKRHKRNLPRYTNIAKVGNQDIAGRFTNRAALAQSWKTAQDRLTTTSDTAKHNRTITDPKLRKLHQNSSTYYGEFANLIRESYQLNEKKKGPCWKGYEAIGMKMKGGRKVPNCVPKKK